MAASAPFGGPEGLLVLLAALAINLIGGHLLVWRSLPSVETVVRSVTLELDRRLNRIERGDTTRLIRGLVMVLGLVGLAAAAGATIAAAGRSWPIVRLLEVVLLTSCLSTRRMWQHLATVRTALDHLGIDAARVALVGLARRNPATLDGFGIARAAVEAGAKTVNQGLVSPVFWYVLLGLPGVLVWTAVNVMDSVVGHRSARYADFGLAAARLDDALNLLPARLTAVLIALAAVFTAGCNPWGALRTMWRDARYHPSINAGWPVAAVGGALGLALVGPYYDGGVLVREVWIGHGRARVTGHDIGRAQWLFTVTALLVVAALVGLLGAMVAA